MSQRGIREFDAKKMRSDRCGLPYAGMLVECQEDLNNVVQHLEQLQAKYMIDARIVKPDQLVGQRGKHGLVGVNLSAPQVQQRIGKRWHQEVVINGTTGILHTFLIEPYLPHQEEYYLSFETVPGADRIRFYPGGGVDIESHRDEVSVVDVMIGETLDDQICHQLLGKYTNEIGGFVRELYQFMIEYGLTYLEINPFTRDGEGQRICLDMVVKVDTCEAWKQTQHRTEIKRVKPFGEQTHPFETIVEEVDSRTGASLKCTVLNPRGRIGLILGGGGASIVTMDTFDQMGLTDEIINYGELSGNPGYDDNRVYVQGLLDIMTSNNHKQQVLCLIGGIANFTRIDVLCRAFVDVLRDNVENLKKHAIHIMVRRGGVNDTKGLKMLEDFCREHELTYSVADGDVYLTEAIRNITLVN